MKKSEPVAWVIFDNGFIDDHTVDKHLAGTWEDRGHKVTALFEHSDPTEALIAQLADMRERLQLIADNSDDKNVVEICRFALEQK